jgi:hypothetical protein
MTDVYKLTHILQQQILIESIDTNIKAILEGVRLSQDQIEAVFQVASKDKPYGTGRKPAHNIGKLYAGLVKTTSSLKTELGNKIERNKLLGDINKLSPLIKKELVKSGRSDLTSHIDKIVSHSTGDVLSLIDSYSMLSSLSELLEVDDILSVESLLKVFAKDNYTLSESAFGDKIRELLNRNVIGKSAIQGYDGKKLPGNTFDELMVGWEDAGSPTDSDALTNYLMSRGYPKDMIAKMYDKAASKNPHISTLAKEIKKFGLTSHVLSLLNGKNDPNKLGFSTESLYSSGVILEAKLTNAQIKELFTLLINPVKTDEKDKEKRRKMFDRYIRKWKSELDRTSDNNSRKTLFREVVNFLADRKEYSEWSDYSKYVQNIIRDEMTVGDPLNYDDLKKQLSNANKITDVDKRKRVKSSIMSKMNRLRKNVKSYDSEYNDYLKKLSQSIMSGNVVEGRIPVTASSFIKALCEYTNNNIYGRNKK